VKHKIWGPTTRIPKEPMINDGILSASQIDDIPFLVILVRERPLLNVRRILVASVSDVDSFAAVLVDDSAPVPDAAAIVIGGRWTIIIPARLVLIAAAARIDELIVEARNLTARRVVNAGKIEPPAARAASGGVSPAAFDRDFRGAGRVGPGTGIKSQTGSVSSPSRSEFIR
jgi:hypothetical protein